MTLPLIDLSHPRPGLVVATGELDLATAPALGPALARSADLHPEVALDLSRVTFMDGSGLSALLRARNDLARRGGSLRLLTPHARVSRVLRLTALEAAFTIG